MVALHQKQNRKAEVDTFALSAFLKCFGFLNTT